MKIFPIVILFFLLMNCQEGENYYSLDDYSKVKKIDSHVHLVTDRRDFMEKAGKDNFQIVNVSLETKNGWEEVYRKYTYGQLQQEMFPNKVATITSFSVEDWEDENWQNNVIQWLDSCFQEGVVGVKVWKNIGMVAKDASGKMFMIDDAKFDPIFKFIKDQGKTLLGHLGEPKNCWLPLEEMTTNNDKKYFKKHPEYHMYQFPDLPSYEDQISARDRMLEKNPDLRFVGAHMGSLEWSVDELAKTLDKFPNMAVGLAARMGQIFYQTAENREKVRDFFMAYQDRILYATDLGDGGKSSQEDLYSGMDENWRRDWQYFTTDDDMESDLIDSPFQGLKLPASVVDKIFYHNAIHWFGIEK